MISAFMDQQSNNVPKNDDDGVSAPPSENASGQQSEASPPEPANVSPSLNPATLGSPSPVVIRLNQPFKILTDIWGVLTSYNFRHDLYRYLDEQMAPYLMKHMHRTEVQDFLKDLVFRNIQDRQKYPELPIIGLSDCCDDKQTKVKAIVDNLQCRRASKDTALMAGLDGLFNQVWMDGYRQGTLRPHAFPDVVGAFSRWQTEPYYIKLHTFASGPWENQKLFLSATDVGDLSKFIISGIDAHSHYKYDWTKYKAVLNTLDERTPANLIYLTDSPNKAKPALKAGMRVFIVRRPGNRKYKEAALEPYLTIDSFDQLDFIPAEQ